MNDLAARVTRIRQIMASAAARASRPLDDITLIAASKGATRAQIGAARLCGITVFGENRVQDAHAKFIRPSGQSDATHADALRVIPPIQLHLIGPLQTNKVRRAVGFFDLIHSLDGLRLAEAIQREAERRAIRQSVLVQVNIANEPTKHGVSPDEAARLVEAVRRLPNLSLLGLMAIPPAVSHPEDARPYFSGLRTMAAALELHRLSMGMSSDFQVAIEEGATWIRVGTALFRSEQ